MVCSLAAEEAVELLDDRGQHLLQNIDNRIVGPRMELVVAHLGGNAAPHRLGIGAVTAAGPLNAQLFGGQHGDR